MAEIALPDGRTAQYWVGGAPAGPAVLFFHGCPDTRWAARTGASAARRAGVRLLCVNRQGYGRSSVAASTHASAADDAVAVAERLDLAVVAALGMSVGGGYAAACAAGHPDRVRRVALVNTLAPPAEAPPGSVEEAMAEHAPGFAEYVAGVDPADPDDAALVRRFTSGLPGPDARALLDAVPAADLATSVREALARPEGYLRDAALTFRPWEVDLAAVGCPADLWYGEADERARTGVERLTAALPDARLHVVPGATHLATLLGSWEHILTALR